MAALEMTRVAGPDIPDSTLVETPFGGEHMGAWNPASWATHEGSISTPKAHDWRLQPSAEATAYCSESLVSFLQGSGTPLPAAQSIARAIDWVMNRTVSQPQTYNPDNPFTPEEKAKHSSTERIANGIAQSIARQLPKRPGYIWLTDRVLAAASVVHHTGRNLAFTIQASAKRTWVLMPEIVEAVDSKSIAPPVKQPPIITTHVARQPLSDVAVQLAIAAPPPAQSPAPLDMQQNTPDSQPIAPDLDTRDVAAIHDVVLAEHLNSIRAIANLGRAGIGQTPLPPRVRIGIAATLIVSAPSVSAEPVTSGSAAALEALALQPHDQTDAPVDRPIDDPEAEQPMSRVDCYNDNRPPLTEIDEEALYYTLGGALCSAPVTSELPEEYKPSAFDLAREDAAHRFAADIIGRLDQLGLTLPNRGITLPREQNLEAALTTAWLQHGPVNSADIDTIVRITHYTAHEHERTKISRAIQSAYNNIESVSYNLRTDPDYRIDLRGYSAKDWEQADKVARVIFDRLIHADSTANLATASTNHRLRVRILITSSLLASGLFRAFTDQYANQITTMYSGFFSEP